MPTTFRCKIAASLHSQVPHGALYGPGFTAEGTDEQSTRDHSRVHGGCVRAGLQPSASLRPECSATVQLSSRSREGPLARIWRWDRSRA